MFKVIGVVGMISLLVLSPSSARASAGWYPIAKGQSITVEYCLPTADVGVLYLQATSEGSKSKTVATIKSPKLKKDKYCVDDVKYGFGEGLYHFRYKWKVNITGGSALQLFSGRLKRVFYGWPDGITTNGK